MDSLKEKLVELLADVGLCHYDTIADHLISNDTVIITRCKKCKYLRRGRVVFSCRHPNGLKEPDLAQNTGCQHGELEENEN